MSINDRDLQELFARTEKVMGLTMEEENILIRQDPTKVKDPIPVVHYKSRDGRINIWVAAKAPYFDPNISQYYHGVVSLKPGEAEYGPIDFDKLVAYSDIDSGAELIRDPDYKWSAAAMTCFQLIDTIKSS